MDKSKIKTKFFVSFLIAIFVASPYMVGKSLAATTTLTVVTTQANVPAHTIPPVIFYGGSDAVSASVPAVTFADGADATSDGMLPAITFTSGTVADLVSIPAIVADGGVDEVKASQTLTVGTLPANNETIIIGNCTVTFVDGAGTGNNSSATNDSDCIDDTATINNYTSSNPGVALLAGQVAVFLRMLTNVSDSVHGALVTSGLGTDAIFTTVGTETVVGNIAFADGTSGKITNVPVTSVVGIQASATITMPFGLAANATDHSITIDDVVIDLGINTKTPAGIADTLAHTDFSSGTTYAVAPYTVTNPVGAEVKFTIDSLGAAPNGNSLPVQDADYTATNNNPSNARFTIADALYGGDPYDHSVTIDGITIDIGSSAQTTALIALAINDAINLDVTKDYTSEVSGSTITLTENSLGAVGNGVTLPVTDGNYTKTGPLAAAVTIAIPSGMSVDAPDHSIEIDGVSVELGTAAKTADEIAALIAAADFSGKNYTVANPSGANLTFTQKTGGAAGNVSLTRQDADYTTANAVAASDSISVPDALLAGSADHSLEIDGVTIELGTAVKTADEIAALIAAADFSGKNYTVANPSGADLTFTKNSSGAAGNVSLDMQDDEYGTMTQIVTITPANMTTGETATVTINDVDYSYVIQAGDAAADVVSGLKLAITSLDVTTSGTDTLILTAVVPGTAFTVGDSLDDAPAVVVPDTKKKTKYYGLYGYVKEQSTLIPIGGALVRVYTLGGTKKCSVKTNKNGRYFCSNLKGGKKYKIKVSAVGYQNQADPTKVNVSHILKINSSKRKNIYLAKKYPVSLR